jgi:GAF domain-containing protein
VLADPNYTASEYQRLGNYRTNLGVPLLREGAPIGVFVLTRQQVRPFTDRQIELVQTFADQAVIAIENVRLFDEVQARTRDLTEALQQQTATADVLKVISRSAFDLQAVLDTLVESAVSLIDASSGVIWLREGEVFNVKAASGAEEEQEFFAQLRARPQKPGRSSIGARVLLTGEVQVIGDIRADPDYDPDIKAATKARALLGVPLLRDGAIIGAFVLALHRLGTFTPRQIDLVQTFADQAVIAIENVRLFDEVQARTRDLTEALQQQTATAEVLKVISRSAFDLQAVWRTLVESACKLCDAPMGLIELLDGDVFRLVMQTGYGAAFERYLSDNPLRAGSASGTGRAASTGEVSHIPDVLQDPDYLLSEAQRLAGYRSNLAVPLLRENKVIGVFVLGRPTPGPFTERQIELVKTFADQAVIAIENVRLFDEVQARTRDLSEALQQQTATADVLKVISRSAFDLQPVLDTLINSAVELSGANRGAIFLRDGDFFRWQAASGTDAEYLEYVRSHPRPPGRGSVVGRVALSGRVECIADILEDREFELPASVLARARGVLGVPLLRDGKVEGAIVLSRYTPGLCSRRQIDLVQTFADQAVIAIENVRLFDEVQARTRDLEESLAQQTATADVLKAISRTAFDLDTVLETLISTALRLCDAKYGQIFRRHGDVYRYAASQMDVDPAYLEHEQTTETRPGRGTLVGRVALENRAVEVADAWNDPEYEEKDQARIGNVRAMLGVPLMRNGEPIGAFALARSAPVPFTQRQVELVTTFADQAVIAIENVRLFDEVQARTRDLTEALQQQTATAEVLKVISRSAFDLQAVWRTLVESASPLSAKRPWA